MVQGNDNYEVMVDCFNDRCNQKFVVWKDAGNPSTNKIIYFVKSAIRNIALSVNSNSMIPK
jgi:hypothetical protein